MAKLGEVMIVRGTFLDKVDVRDPGALPEVPPPSYLP
jgi:hypothetical protein